MRNSPIRSLFKSLRQNQTGFTVIELLIVIIGLTILAFLAVPTAKNMMAGSDTLNGANIEAFNVKTAAISYQANTGKFPADSDALWHDPPSPTDYLSQPPRAYYQIDIGTGKIITATIMTPGHIPANPWTGISWNAKTDCWAKQ